MRAGLRGVGLLAAAVMTAAVARPVQTPAFASIQPDLFSTGGTLVNAFADVDGDDDLDLFVGFGGAANRLSRNDAGRFTDIAAAAGLAEARASRAAAWGDADGDGDPDLLLGFAPGPASVLKLYRNDRGVFADITEPSGLSTTGGAVRQTSWVDVDADGDLDVFVAFRDRANVLFRQDRGRFTNVAAAIGLADARKTVGAVWVDVDQDDDLDLYVGNMDGDANGLYRNDAGRFTDVAESLGVAWGGRAPREVTNGTVRPCAEDVDNDGRFDLFMANYGPNGLFLNRAGAGGPRFEDVSAAWGVAIDGRYDSCAFADIDHDGHLDLYLNGTVTGGVSYRDYLFINRPGAGGGRRFEDATPDDIKALQADHGVQWADVDGDGDLDLALTGTRADGMHALLRNARAAAPDRRSLQVRVVDARGHARFAGGEVCAFATGASRRLACRLIDTGSGYNAQNDAPVHLAWQGDGRIDVVVTPRQTGVAAVRASNVDPGAHVGRALVVRVGR